MDTWLSFSQLIALSQQCDIPRGALTPLIFSRRGEASAALPPFWLDTKGNFTSQALPCLQVLADPQAVNGIAFILPDFIIEGSLCYPDPASGRPQVSLLNSGEGLHLQSPILPQSLLSVLQSQLLQETVDFQPIGLSLPILDAWLLLAMVDLGREREKPPIVSLDDLAQALNRSYNLLQNLAAWYCQALELKEPSMHELKASIQRLAGQGLVVTSEAGGVQAAGVTRRLIHEFSDLNAFLMLKTSVLLDEDEDGLGSMRNWIFQGASGMGLLFFVNGETAEMVSLSPANILNLVRRLLQDPFRFFSKKGNIPARKHTRVRMPPPPEKL
ncbi:MAG: hypothetical protein ACYC6R_14120 [Anaerolineales bacterium]